MKTIVLVCSQMSDEPIEELGKRTPLEIAKTPQMDALASKAVLGCVSFIPRSLKPATDVAMMSVLGFDPLEFYTGIAPLDAMATGLALEDREIVFRCDFVTALDDVLIDQTAGRISSREANILLEAVVKKTADPRFKFYSGNGYKNLLVIKDPELVDDLDEAECLQPNEILGKKISKFMPKAKAGLMLTELMNRAKEVLETHEINRVRIDLRENPANRLWLWGQGKQPKMPAFEQRFGLKGGVCAEKDFVRGLAMAAGLGVYDSLEQALDQCDFILVYHDLEDPGKSLGDLKTRVRHIEDFDLNCVKPVSERLREDGSLKVLITTDVATSMAGNAFLRESVPFLIAGSSIVGNSPQADGFGEKACAKSKFEITDGFRLIEYFLDRKKINPCKA